VAAVQKVTQIPWRITSYLRDDGSSHSRGVSVDIAPFDVQPSDYAVSRGEDPLLSYRRALLDRLKMLEDVDFGVPIAFVVESDHLHIQMSGPSRTRASRNLIVPWRLPRPHLYPDSAELHAAMRLADPNREGVSASVIREVRRRISDK
jgi:hypothetical protein